MSHGEALPALHLARTPILSASQLDAKTRAPFRSLVRQLVPPSWGATLLLLATGCGKPCLDLSHAGARPPEEEVRLFVSMVGAQVASVEVKHGASVVKLFRPLTPSEHAALEALVVRVKGLATSTPGLAPTMSLVIDRAPGEEPERYPLELLTGGARVGMRRATSTTAYCSLEVGFTIALPDHLVAEVPQGSLLVSGHTEKETRGYEWLSRTLPDRTYRLQSPGGPAEALSRYARIEPGSRFTATLFFPSGETDFLENPYIGGAFPDDFARCGVVTGQGLSDVVLQQVAFPDLAGKLTSASEGTSFL